MSLKSIRSQCHLSQEQLSDLAGLNVRTIQRIENGSKPSIESLKCLASALDVDIQDISQPAQTDNVESHESQMNRIFMCLIFTSIFVLFGAKSESTSPETGAFFYFCGAICFVYTAVTLHKRRL